MKFDLKRLVGVMINGVIESVDGADADARPILNGQPQSDTTAVRLAGGGYILIKDKSIDALFFTDKEPDALN